MKSSDWYHTYWKTKYRFLYDTQILQTLELRARMNCAKFKWATLTGLATELWIFIFIVSLVPPVGKMQPNFAELLKTHMCASHLNMVVNAECIQWVMQIWTTFHNDFMKGLEEKTVLKNFNDACPGILEKSLTVRCYESSCRNSYNR